jgi:hypothetical protein
MLDQYPKISQSRFLSQFSKFIIHDYFIIQSHVKKHAVDKTTLLELSTNLHLQLMQIR